ncbi:hypothetical protein GJ496_009452 [Pomphorhynchus laevis]|nr:hypothetical protein GJ496_009452 [Pomphorhynchus laevis]
MLNATHEQFGYNPLNTSSSSSNTANTSQAGTENTDQLPNPRASQNTAFQNNRFTSGLNQLGQWKESLVELSGGQRSLAAMSLILALLRYKLAPIYIMDEIDAALEMSHTQNMGVMIQRFFHQSQFIIVSLKDGMFKNANVLFKTTLKKVLIGSFQCRDYRHNNLFSRRRIIANTDDKTLSWIGFKMKYNKIYKSSDEERFRREVFIENMRYIEDHNEQYLRGKETFYLGPNELLDRTDHEMSSKISKKLAKLKSKRWTQPDTAKKRRVIKKTLKKPQMRLPSQMDWREYGIVSPVKYQGNCGSCWAFTSIAVLEIQNIRRVGKLVELSEQQLIDCSKNYGNHGCDGGFIDPSFHYIRDNRGINSNQIYPYEAKEGSCRFDSSIVDAVVTKWIDIESGNERQLKETLAFVGPVAVAFDGRQRSFRYYRGGIYKETNCTKNILDHSGVIVGYGTSRGEDYWIIKNSWGKDWGEHGYIRYARNRNNMCGVASIPSYPIVF